MVQRGTVRLDHIGTDERVVDILTKPLGKVKFLTFRESLGIVERPYDGVLLDDELWELWGPFWIASRSYKQPQG